MPPDSDRVEIFRVSGRRCTMVSRTLSKAEEIADINQQFPDLDGDYGEFTKTFY
jgi:hypothetical protein